MPSAKNAKIMPLENVVLCHNHQLTIHILATVAPGSLYCLALIYVRTCGLTVSVYTHVLYILCSRYLQYVLDAQPLSYRGSSVVGLNQATVCVHRTLPSPLRGPLLTVTCGNCKFLLTLSTLI